MAQVPRRARRTVVNQLPRTDNDCYAGWRGVSQRRSIPLHLFRYGLIGGRVRNHHVWNVVWVAKASGPSIHLCIFFAAGGLLAPIPLAVRDMHVHTEQVQYAMRQRE